ncbi:MAG: aldo/keto reductase [Methyloligellaceae bacterium]
MDRRRFGRTELGVPAMTYGGGWVGGLLIRGSEEERESVLDKALAAGVDWIDTAASYGDGVSETVIGEWLAKLAERERPRISTKFNLDVPAGDFEGQMFRSVEASFERLGVDRLPLIILHNRIVDDDQKGQDARGLALSELLGSGGVADAMDKLRAQSLCDWIGMTALGSPKALHQAVDSGRIDVAQVYYNLLNATAVSGAGADWNSTDFDGLLTHCAAQDMGVMGIRILAAGHLAATERHGREIPITANTEDAAEEARARAVFDALGSEHGSAAQTAIRFGLNCPLLSTIEVGIGETWHLDEALKGFEMGPLPQSALDALEGLWRDHPAFNT